MALWLVNFEHYKFRSQDTLKYAIKFHSKLKLIITQLSVWQNTTNVVQKEKN